MNTRVKNGYRLSLAELPEVPSDISTLVEVELLSLSLSSCLTDWPLTD